MAAIKTARDFMERIVVPDIEESLEHKADLRLAYHACISLFSLRDWIFDERRNTDWTYNGIGREPFKQISELQNSLRDIEPSFDCVSDIANAAKHKVLERGYTALYGAANTEIKRVATMISSGAILGALRLNTAALNSAPIMQDTEVIMVKINDEDYPVLAHIARVHGMWTQLMTENSW